MLLLHCNLAISTAPPPQVISILMTVLREFMTSNIKTSSEQFRLWMSTALLSALHSRLIWPLQTAEQIRWNHQLLLFTARWEASRGSRGTAGPKPRGLRTLILRVTGFGTSFSATTFDTLLFPTLFWVIWQLVGHSKLGSLMPTVGWFFFSFAVLAFNF